MENWAAYVCDIAVVWRNPGQVSIRDLFAPMRPHLRDKIVFLDAVTDELRRRPELVERWQHYSWDKRSSPSPYLCAEDDPPSTGFYDGTTRARRTRVFNDAIGACADFILREAAWVLLREPKRQPPVGAVRTVD